DDIAADDRQTLVRAVEADVAAAVGVDDDVTDDQVAGVTDAELRGVGLRGGDRRHGRAATWLRGLHAHSGGQDGQTGDRGRGDSGAMDALHANYLGGKAGTDGDVPCANGDGTPSVNVRPKGIGRSGNPRKYREILRRGPAPPPPG